MVSEYGEISQRKWGGGTTTPTCQVFGPHQHQHAAQDVEAQRRAAEDAALTFGSSQSKNTEKRSKVAAFHEALIFNHTGNILDLNQSAAE